ncbi:hypothetical protein XENOCAPTIV_025990 [Xenoophorus captivus]|uniref:Uncharacterized protein n=1 Tax=Xenoophorus captivus TaxID=1517983 RepID=A0ABV0SBJ1_9TELE
MLKEISSAGPLSLFCELNWATCGWTNMLLRNRGTRTATLDATLGQHVNPPGSLLVAHKNIMHNVDVYTLEVSTKMYIFMAVYLLCLMLCLMLFEWRKLPLTAHECKSDQLHCNCKDDCN